MTVRSVRRGAAALATLGLLAGCAAGAGAPGGLVASAPRDPATLIGLDPGGLESMLGAPELRRREPPAEMWQYRTEACVLDLYLFADGDDAQSVPAVVDYAARARTAEPDGGPVDPARCLGALAARPVAGTS